MLSPVTSVSSVYPTSVDQHSNSKPAAPPSPAPSHQDTVTISPAAQKASVDVDHDGDSH